MKGAIGLCAGCLAFRALRDGTSLCERCAGLIAYCAACGLPADAEHGCHDPGQARYCEVDGWWLGSATPHRCVAKVPA